METAFQRQYPERNARFGFSPVEVDITRIEQSLSSLLLTQKTQVMPRNIRSFWQTLWPPRSRSNHSSAVANLARKICRILGLYEDLAYAIGLGHDNGHSPFGHAGEKKLDIISKQHGEEFDHDAQTVRNFTLIEKISDEYDGLNLTNQIITDLIARSKRLHNSYKGPENYPKGVMSLEAQVVEISDKLAFILHDLEDLLMLLITNFDELREQPLLRKMIDNIESKEIRIQIKIMNDRLKDYFLTSLINNMCPKLEKIKSKLNVNSQTHLILTEEKVIQFEDVIEQEFFALLEWMYSNLYGTKMEERDNKAGYTIEAIFNLLYNHDNLRNSFNNYQLKRGENSLVTFVRDLIVYSGEDKIDRFMYKYIMA